MIRDSFIFYPNNLTPSAAGKKMMNLSRTRCHISLLMNAVISGVHADVEVPFVMVCST